MKNFRNKVVLITGGSRGVGLALARRLCKEGARVVITARGEKRLLQSHKELSDAGGQVASVTGDVGDWVDAERMVQTALDNFGKLDVLVNNAGVSMRGDFADLNPEVCQRVIQTNLIGSVLPTRAAMPHLLAAKGSVVFISSIAGLFGLPGASVYCASKGALTNFAESLRLEYGAAGLHAGVVYLGFTEHDPEKRILAADGAEVPPDRPAHHSQANAARLIADLIAKRRSRVVMTPVGNIGYLVHRLSPDIVEKTIALAKSSRLGIYERFS